MVVYVHVIKDYGNGCCMALNVLKADDGRSLPTLTFVHRYRLTARKRPPIRKGREALIAILGEMMSN